MSASVASERFLLLPGTAVAPRLREAEGMIYTRDCVFCPGSVTIEGNKIKNIESCALSELTQQEQQQYLIPGLVDVHFHGAAGYDFCDGIHVHPSVVRNTFRLFGDDRVILISDSMRAAGMEDGNYTLGGQDVIVKGALATLADGTLAGSVTNLFDCMKKQFQWGFRENRPSKPRLSIQQEVLGSIRLLVP